MAYAERVRIISIVVFLLPLPLIAEQFFSLGRLHAHGLSTLFYIFFLNVWFRTFLLYSPLPSDLSPMHKRISRQTTMLLNSLFFYGKRYTLSTFQTLCSIQNDSPAFPIVRPTYFLISLFCLVSHPRLISFSTFLKSMPSFVTLF